MTAILLLRLEHHRFDDLLNLIENQLDENSAFDRELLQNVVAYFAGYPEQCHHPVEDLVFRKLLARNAERAAAVGEILEEHRETAELTEQFGAELAAVEVDASNLPVSLREIIRQFVDHYRSHMIAEEKNFF